MSTVPAVLDEAVLTALERHPTDRYESVAEFQTALNGIRTDGPLPPTLAKWVADESRRLKNQPSRPSTPTAGRETNTERSATDATNDPSGESTADDVLQSLVAWTASVEAAPVDDNLVAHVPHLVQALTDPTPHIRHRSALVLGQLTEVDPSVLSDHIGDLAAVLDPERDRSNDDQLRTQVASMLATLAAEHDVTPAVSTCGRLLRTEGNTTVREHAAQTLLNQSLNHSPAPASTCIEELIGALHDPLKEVRNRVSLVLLELASLDSTHLAPYREELEQARSNDSERVATRIQSICEQLPNQEAVSSATPPQHRAANPSDGTGLQPQSQHTTEVTTPQSWPLFGRNPARSGHHPSTTGPVDSVSVKWSFEAGELILPSPIVVDDTVYVGSWDTNLYAVDACSGERTWTFTEQAGIIQSSAAVDDGTVFIGSYDNCLYAVDTTTGNKQWAFETNNWVDSSPAVVDGTVFVGSWDTNLYAVDTATGDKQWACNTGDSVLSSPAVVNDTVFVGSNDGNMYAVDAHTENQHWTFTTGNWVESTPAVADGTVFVGSNDGTLYAVSTTNGSQLCTFEAGDAISSSPAVVDDTVYVGSDDGNLYAVAAATSEKRWVFETDGLVYSSPAVVNKTVYVGSTDTSLYAIAAETGNQRWTFEADDWIRSSPAVVDGTVYVGTEDGTLYAVERREAG